MATATPQHTDSMQWLPRVVPVACAEGGEPDREGLSVTTLCTWRRSSSCCRAAQQEEPAELAGREPSAGGGWYGGLARLGAARAHGEAARGAANVLLGSISTFTSQPLVARALRVPRLGARAASSETESARVCTSTRGSLTHVCQ